MKLIRVCKPGIILVLRFDGFNRQRWLVSRELARQIVWTLKTHHERIAQQNNPEKKYERL